MWLLTSTLAPLRSLSRLRGRAGVGVSPHEKLAEQIDPHPPRSYERVDLPRKRER
jgi:hypothetical protein